MTLIESLLNVFLNLVLWFLEPIICHLIFRMVGGFKVDIEEEVSLCDFFVRILQDIIQKIYDLL